MSFTSKGLDSFVSSTLPVILELLKGLDTPISLSISLLLRAVVDGDKEAYQQLASYSLPIDQYLASDVTRFRLDYQAAVLCSKLPNFLGLDLKAKALESFSEAEYHCKLVNTAFLAGSYDHCLDIDHFRFDDVKHNLSRILGRAPSWSTVLQIGGWGPGSSMTLSQRFASPETKCEYESTVTYKLLKAIQPSLDGCPPWFLTKPFQLVPGNLVTTVPKNLKTDRTIAIEPGVNSWCQKGIGRAIRRRLKKHGIDLNNQSYNSCAALEALSLGFCTVDLKAASDSISLEFLRRVCPSDWLALIEAARSERGCLESRKAAKSWFDYHKVSSMGNGFTFELESAIFYAVLLACGVPKNCAYVYGDDLVFPSQYYERVTQVLGVCGFQTNFEKSFAGGLFYESCGAYSFNGVDVTPLKIKDLLHGPKDVIILANKIRLAAHLCTHNVGCDRRYLPAWRMCISGLPDDVRQRCRGPVGSGLTLFSNLSEATLARYKKSRGMMMTYQLVPKVKTICRDYSSLLKFRIGQLSDLLDLDADCFFLNRDPGRKLGNVVLNRPTGRFKTARLYVERWYNFGDWVFSD